MQSVSVDLININNSKSRIAPVDGLRAVAVLGVIWAHVWLFCGNPVLSIGKIGSTNLDLHRIFSSVGTGVDLFFVISGFCMYLMYARKQTVFDWKAYIIFLKNRWLRIAPAFYVSALTCAIGIYLLGQPFPWLSLISHATFTYLWIPNLQGLAAPFWSLATEWHFYLLLPILIWAASRWRFVPVIAITMLISMIFRAWVYISPDNIEGLWKAQIPMRFIEFAWGMLIAYFYTNKNKIPKILSYEKGFLISLCIAYFGRLLMVTEVINFAGRLGFICKIFAEPILTLGYALILWNVIASNSIFSKSLSYSFPQKIGRWSYSLYLWHWYPCLWISQQVVKYLGKNIVSQHISFFLSLLILIPLSYLSYHYLEEPYFRKRNAKINP